MTKLITTVAVCFGRFLVVVILHYDEKLQNIVDFFS